VESFYVALREAFPEAMVTGFAHLQDQCENDEGDRHVLACAIHCKAEVILTFNLRHFPESATRAWGSPRSNQKATC
jgi:hypothetical protein